MNTYGSASTPPQNLVQNRSCKDRGFSLVEVALAMGVAVVALVSMLGLLGAVVGSGGQTASDTVLVAMTTRIMSDLRAAPFDGLGDRDPRKVVNYSTTLPDKLEESKFRFTDDGVLVEDGESEQNRNIMYECVVTKQVDLESRQVNQGPYNRVKLALTFTWPIAANPEDPSKRPNRQIIYASIARY